LQPRRGCLNAFDFTLVGAVVVASADSLGRGMLLAAPTFGLGVLAGVLVGEATAVHPGRTPTRSAAIETRRLRHYLPVGLAGAVVVLAGALTLLLAATSVSAASDDLGLAVGTAARAYKELEAAGLVRSRRGGGTRVVSSIPALDASERRVLLQQAAAAYVRQALQLGMASHDIVNAVNAALDLPTQTPAPLPAEGGVAGGGREA